MASNSTGAHASNVNQIRSTLRLNPSGGLQLPAKTLSTFARPAVRKHPVLPRAAPKRPLARVPVGSGVRPAIPRPAPGQARAPVVPRPSPQVLAKPQPSAAPAPVIEKNPSNSNFEAFSKDIQEIKNLLSKSKVPEASLEEIICEIRNIKTLLRMFPSHPNTSVCKCCAGIGHHVEPAKVEVKHDAEVDVKVEPAKVDAEVKKIEPTKVETKELAKVEVKKVEKVEAKPTEVKKVEAKPVEVKKVEAKPTEVKKVEAKPTEVKKVEVKPTEVKVESKPEKEKEVKTADSKVKQ